MDVRVCSALNTKEAEEMIVLLWKNGIPAYAKEAGAGSVMNAQMGFAVYGRDVFVNGADAQKAMKVLSQNGQSKEACDNVAEFKWPLKIRVLAVTALILTALAIVISIL